MQALWMAFDKFAGKGIGIVFILKFLWYTTLLVAPQAIPIGVLLSSIMTLGSLSENYEFAAIKSAGISLKRILKPIFFLVLFLSIINFMFLNYVYPYAMLKQINLSVNVKQKQPSLALVAGSFNTEIPNYQIKFDEKYGKDDNFIKNVIIYDLSSKRGNNKIITAKEGEFISEKGSRYMTLILKDGHFFEHHITNDYRKKQRMPASYADFKKYTINIDVSTFNDNDLDKIRYTRNYNMLSLQQLKDTLPEIKQNYDEYVLSRAKSLYLNTNAKTLYKYPDSLIDKKLSSNILENFERNNKENIINTSISRIDRTIESISQNKDTFKYKRKVLNLYDIEFFNRIALSLACLLLFFVGAPLGSIIRKGGMGMPMILAIFIYVTFHFSNTFGRNLAEESKLSAIIGSWLSVAIMLPLAITLTIRASNDKGLLSFDSIIIKIRNIIQHFSKKKNIYSYSKKVNDDILIKMRDKLKNLNKNQIIDFIKNYLQYNLSEEEREACIIILKEKSTNIISKKELENIKYINAVEKYNEYKVTTIISIFIWIVFLAINTYNPILLGIKIILFLVFSLFLIISKDILDELNIIMDNKLKEQITRPYFYFSLGLFLSIVLFYFTNKEIKEKLKSLT